MSLYTDIKDRIVVCMRSGEGEERDILRTLIGEIQLKVEREKKTEASDEMVEKTLSSFKENVETCMNESKDSDYVASMKKEISIYDKFLPTYESVESIVELLKDNVEQIKSAKAVGPATGMAMGVLKKAGKKVKGGNVSAAVAIIRG